MIVRADGTNEEKLHSEFLVVLAEHIFVHKL